VSGDDATALTAALAEMLPTGFAAGFRTIRPDDEAALLPDEARALTTTVPVARRASGAARALARGLMAGLGIAPRPILRSALGAPLWPVGVVGSLAHDGPIAAAVVARVGDAAGVGIDVEPAEPLEADVADLVVTAGDVLGSGDGRLAGRLAFVAKEAVYKAVHPLCGVILDWPDIRLDLPGGRAQTSTGHAARLVLVRAPRLVAVAWVEGEGEGSQRVPPERGRR